MKILFVCENYLPHIGGAEIVFKNLAENMVKLGHEVSLVTHQLKNTKKFEIINGVKVHRVDCFDSRYLFTFLSIQKVIKLARKADVIQTTTFNGAPPAWLAGRLVNKPVVLTVHEVWINKWDKVTNFSKINCFIHNILEKMVYFLKFDKYVTVSEATKKDLIKIGINEKKVKRIYNGFDYNFWNEKNFNGNSVRKKLNLGTKFVYFSWGRPGTSKGFEYVIRAVPKIVEKIPNSIFLLMLGGKEQYKDNYNNLINLIKKLNIKDNVKVISSVKYDELGNYIKAADCVVIPSIAEGFGYTTVEAGALGVPVVASNVGSIPEIISGKYSLFEPKNINDLATKVIKVNGSEFQQSKPKKFLWKECVQKYLQIYNHLISK
ncbi:MAG: glycosyltransferase family 4 protein [Nanoarchaeota archaeon]